MADLVPELLTAGQLAGHLKITERTIREWVRRGIIPSVPITGRVRRFILADVVAALRRRGQKLSTR